MRKLVILASLVIATLAVNAQKKESPTGKDSSYLLDGDAARQLLAQITLDTAHFLTEAATQACGCIDSISKLSLEKDVLRDAIHSCISKASITYQGVIKINRSLTQNSKVIMISTRADETEFRRYYYVVESEVKSSCTSLNKLLFDNNEVTNERSISDNKKAREAYTKGTGFMEAGNYSQAIKWLEKSVSIDPLFAFAWDNLGISYRRSDKLDKAVEAYQASIRIDSMGRTPLMNLPVALGMLGRTDEALAAYKVLLSRYPGDPEAYYGAGRILFQNKKDNVAALEQFCQAYNLYVEQKSPYRSDAESMISAIFKQMKSEGKEAEFTAILKKHHINME